MGLGLWCSGAVAVACGASRAVEDLVGQRVDEGELARVNSVIPTEAGLMVVMETGEKSGQVGPT
jgi:hypothetical protein